MFRSPLGRAARSAPATSGVGISAWWSLTLALFTTSPALTVGGAASVNGSAPDTTVQRSGSPSAISSVR